VVRKGAAEDDHDYKLSYPTYNKSWGLDLKFSVENYGLRPGFF
jgi:hypothetical protein